MAPFFIYHSPKCTIGVYDVTCYMHKRYMKNDLQYTKGNKWTPCLKKMKFSRVLKISNTLHINNIINKLTRNNEIILLLEEATVTLWRIIVKILPICLGLVLL